jgi:hypothetical protein
MTKPTVSAAGGAMPKINRKGVMTPRLGDLPPNLQVPADQVFRHRPQVLRMGVAAGMG